jgi:Fe-S cluster biogenesis protein NfuA
MTNIYLEESPNPNSLKFVVDYLIVPEGEIHDFPDIESASYSPLATELFNFDFVNRVFIMNNFVTITKDEQIDWLTIKDELKNFILNYLDNKKPVILERENVVAGLADDSEVSLKVKTLLEEYVKPAVEQDGGAIEFHSFEDGIVKVLLQGSCSGCPSSMITLKSGIENLLTSMIPEVKAVEAEEI